MVSIPVNMCRMEATDLSGCCAPLSDSPLAESEAETLAGAFRALGDPVRLRLMSFISSAPAGEMCACDLTEPVGRSQPTVSHHLSTLVEAGLLDREQRGRWAWFRVNEAGMDALRMVLR